jgi:diadenosine tetraphosphatase ApaH/serine/threonine PP2A family protein phosphatase
MRNNLSSESNKKSKCTIILTLFVFFSLFFCHLYAKDTQCVWTRVERVVAVGDLHGDYDHFIEILKDPKIGIVDDDLHWIAGKTHLVQIGDVMDRYDYAKKIFVLIMRLEKEAEAAGGKVHMLIGNHEEMNITDFAFNRQGYVTVKQLLSFLPPEYIEKEERKIRKKLGIPPSNETDFSSPLDPKIEAFWEDKINKSRDVARLTKFHVRWHYRKAFLENYAPWILEHNTVIKINDIVFVHGGISEKYSTWPLEKINDQLREELEMFRVALLRNEDPYLPYEIVYDENGPLWFRDYSYRGPEFEPTVDKILSNLNAKSIVTAHTPQQIKSGIEMSRYHGKVWIIDTNISRRYPNGNLSALIIENYGNNIEPWLRPWPENVTSADITHELEAMALVSFLLKNTIQTFVLLDSI